MAEYKDEKRTEIKVEREKSLWKKKTMKKRGREKDQVVDV